MIQCHHPTLTSLDVSHGAPPQFFEVLFQCQRLERLHLWNMWMWPMTPTDWIKAYEKTWSRMKSLTLYQNGFDLRRQGRPPGYIIPLSEIMTTLSTVEQTMGRTASIQHLHLRGMNADPSTGQAHIWLIQQCADLVHLKWYTDRYLE